VRLNGLLPLGLRELTHIGPSTSVNADASVNTDRPTKSGLALAKIGGLGDRPKGLPLRRHEAQSSPVGALIPVNMVVLVAPKGPRRQCRYKA